MLTASTCTPSAGTSRITRKVFMIRPDLKNTSSQVIQNLVQVFRVIYRDRHTDFRSTNHIDRSLVTFKDFEYFAQETMSKQHTA